MKSKMWKKIFKNKSSKLSATDKERPPTSPNPDIDQMMAGSSSQDCHRINSASSSSKSSKLSKMVNSFTLKRNSNKENHRRHHDDYYNSEIAISIIRNTEEPPYDDDYQRQTRTAENFVKFSDSDELPLTPFKDYSNDDQQLLTNNSLNEPAIVEIIDLQQCPICTRKFVPATLTKHVSICEKMATKKRKTFDSSRQRREGTELAAFLPKNFGLPIKSTTTLIDIKTPKIQIQESTPILKRTENIIETNHQQQQQQQQQPPQRQNSSINMQLRKSVSPVNQMKLESRAKAAAKRAQPPSAEQCPCCGRCFGIKAFDRHVEWCKEKTKITPAKNNSTDLLTAKERLAARTQYRAPCLKAKRAAIRNKYAGFGDDGQSIDGSVDNNFLSMSNSLSSSFISDGKQIGRKSLSGFDLLKKPEILIKKQKSFVSVDDITEIKKMNCTNNVPPIKPAIFKFTLPKQQQQQQTTTIKNPKVEILKKPLIPSLQQLNHEIPKKSNSNPTGRKIAPIKKCNNQPKQINNEESQLIMNTKISKQNLMATSVNNNNRKLHENMPNLTVDDGNRKEEIISLNSDQYINEMAINQTKLIEPTVEPKLPLKRPNSLRIILPPINRPSVASICPNDLENLMSSTDLINDEISMKNLSKIAIKKPKKLTLPTLNSNHKSNISSDKYWMDVAANKLKINSRPSRSKDKKITCNSKIIENNFSGFSDKYDPFMSAKRQLEELCSPTATDNHQTIPVNNITRPKYTTSLSTSYTSATTTNQTPSIRNTLNQTAAAKSNFRRTSSLRSPRKPTPCSRPLFVPPSRSRPTTIQRGISDEGPISTNFIKTEEFDEMPVKSACINNFATAINSPQFGRRDSSPQKVIISRSVSREPSPLVIKRDASTNLNRRNLRLNLNNNNHHNNNKENTSGNNMPLLKTDSLAVFLKYETELLTKNTTDLNTNHNEHNTTTTTTILPQSIKPITEKDWKDQSNILNKQNSVKNSSNDLVEKVFTNNNDKDKLTSLKNSLTNLLDGVNQKNHETTNRKLLQTSPEINTTTTTPKLMLPIKLEPLPKSLVIRGSYNNNLTSPPIITTTASPSLLPVFPQINLKSLLFNESASVAGGTKDSDFIIDPQLINICDNLQINKLQQIDTSSSSSNTTSSQDSTAATSTAKLLPTISNHTNIKTQTSLIPIVTGGIGKNFSPPPPVRNSADKKNLLKRQIRLGKNQFLYDASPSDDNEFSPDSINNRTINFKSFESNEKQFDSLLSPSQNPIFHDIDFEEILSSFETDPDNHFNDDEEHFPGFKDYKEFLMNHCLNMRSMNQFNINNNNTNNNHNNHNNPSPEKTIRSHKIEMNDMLMLVEHDDTKNIMKSNQNDDDDNVHDDREIFISIETDQNDNETSNPCPNDPAIKNPNIEEINGNDDNKFTKIETYHLPIFEEPDESLSDEFLIIDDINKTKIHRKNVKNHHHQHQVDEIEDEEDMTTVQVEKINTNPNYPIDSDEISSVECFPVGRRSVKSKASADSAYGSLSRQSPTLTDRSLQQNRNNNNTNNRLPNHQSSLSSDLQESPSPQQQVHHHHHHHQLKSADTKQHRLIRQLSGSSSGSEQSLPPINSHQNHHNSNYHQQRSFDYSKESINHLLQNDCSSSRSTPQPQLQQSQQNINGGGGLSKFCHECGNRFVVTQAKFCMECGVKRIILD